MSAGPVHPSPLSPDPGFKSQPRAASAPSYLSAVYCLFHSAISPKLGPPLPSRLMKMGFYWLGSPTSAFIKDMSVSGGRGGEMVWGVVVYCRIVCCTERGMGCPFQHYLFQLYTVVINPEPRCSVEVFGKRSRLRLAADLFS